MNLLPSSYVASTIRIVCTASRTDAAIEAICSLDQHCSQLICLSRRDACATAVSLQHRCTSKNSVQWISVPGVVAGPSVCDPETVVATLSGLSANLRVDNDAIKLDFFRGGQLDYLDSTCIDECQANDACFAFDETADAECVVSLQCSRYVCSFLYCAFAHRLSCQEARHTGTASSSASSPDQTKPHHGGIN